ncbi:hypothetical protein BMS3Abin01_00779 [bacterium BMS3Abin01]|nr:hypothetical protein BMS3Abin01_00779 [bacterium BMS3Abin01]
MFVSEQPARTPQARLYLVKDEQGALLIHQAARRLQESLFQGIDTAFALDRFHHHRADSFVHRLLQGGNIIAFHISEARKQRPEGLLLLRLGGGGERSHGAAMEAAVKNDYPDFPLAAQVTAPFTRQFYGALVSLGAAVGKEHLAAEAVLGDQLRQPGGGHRVIKVGHMAEHGRLLPDGPHHGGMAVPQIIDGQAGYEIQVGVAFFVIQVTALAPHENHRLPGVGGHDVAIVLLFDVCHKTMCFTRSWCLYPCG